MGAVSRARRWSGEAADVMEVPQAQCVLDSIGDAVVCTNAAGRITYLNAAAEGLAGWTRQEALDRRFEDTIHIVDGETRMRVPDPMALAMAHDKVVFLGRNSMLLDRRGNEVAIDDTAAPVHGRHGQVIGAVMVFRDVSAAREHARQLAHHAHHDLLTGLPNRLLLLERLVHAMSIARRRGSTVAVMYLDLDRFKYINDTLGHEVGDGLLQSVAQRLAVCVRESDTVSRWGGDEFVLLLAETSGPRDAALVAGKVLARFREPHRVGPHMLMAGASIGIGVYPGDGASAESLLRHADIALLRAKSDGRGTYRFFDSKGAVAVADGLLRGGSAMATLTAAEL